MRQKKHQSYVVVSGFMDGHGHGHGHRCRIPRRYPCAANGCSRMRVSRKCASGCERTAKVTLTLLLAAYCEIECAARYLHFVAVFRRVPSRLRELVRRFELGSYHSYRYLGSCPSSFAECDYTSTCALQAFTIRYKHATRQLHFG